MHVSVHYVACKWRYAPFVMLILNKYLRGIPRLWNTPSFSACLCISSIAEKMWMKIRRNCPSKLCVRTTSAFFTFTDRAETIECIRDWSNIHGSASSVRMQKSLWPLNDLGGQDIYKFRILLEFSINCVEATERIEMVLQQWQNWQPLTGATLQSSEGSEFTKTRPFSLYTYRTRDCSF